MRTIKIRGNSRVPRVWLHLISLGSALLALVYLTGCKTNKNIVSDKSLASDSLAHSEHHRTTVVIDSAIRHFDFSFDSLKIEIERPGQYAEAPKIIRLKAIKGRVIDRRREHRDSVEAYNSLDTVRYRQAAVEASIEHTATTRLYNPPDGTIISVAALLAAAVLIWLFLRKR